MASTRPQRKAANAVTPADVIAKVGTSNDHALAYVFNPDPRLSRLSRKARESLITEVPPVTAAALLGPAALARHLVASAASGRYRDLFALWTLFSQRTQDCKPVLAERPQALDKARKALTTAVSLGLQGHAHRVAEDIARAEGLIWQWLREAVVAALPAVGRRPAVASALLWREPDLAVPLPDDPDVRWLAEAATARTNGPLAPPVEALLAAGAGRLRPTVATLTMAHEHYPSQLDALVARIDLDSDEIGSVLAWARDHGRGEQLRARVRSRLDEAATLDRAQALLLWRVWRERGIAFDLPDGVKAGGLDGLDLARPETAELAAMLVGDGMQVRAQERLNELAGRNRQLAEKAYEAFVCAGLDVTLPAALAGNPIVKDGTRCPHCAAWTWVRPGHEQRCPLAAAQAAS